LGWHTSALSEPPNVRGTQLRLISFSLLPRSLLQVRPTNNSRFPTPLRHRRINSGFRRVAFLSHVARRPILGSDAFASPGDQFRFPTLRFSVAAEPPVHPNRVFGLKGQALEFVSRVRTTKPRPLSRRLVDSKSPNLTLTANK
jgi:hypothetical protein